MAAVGRLLKRDPSLAPLFAAVGFGVCGALAFGSHYLRHSSDVVIKKKQNPDPWNHVEQGPNTKLMTRNKDWWASRADLPNPRAVFAFPVEAHDPTPSNQAVAARDGAVKRAKERTMAAYEKEGSFAADREERTVAH